MTENRGRRRTNPSDPTEERTSDPVPLGEDIIGRDTRGRHSTPRRYDEKADEPARSSDEESADREEL